MKIIRYIAIVLLLIAVSLYAICFTSFGNKIVASYIEDSVKEKSGVDIKFNKFDIGFSDANISALVNNEINFNIEGKFSIFTQRINLDYRLLANDLKSANISLKKPISVKGKIKGHIGDFDINGLGSIFNSNLSYLANIKNYKPFTAKINGKKLDISEILTLANQPIYANGSIDIQADIKDENGKRDGVVEIKIDNALLNTEVIYDKFKITLPKNFWLKTAVNATIKDDNIDAKSILQTPVAVANTQNTRYNITKNDLNSDFSINLNELSRLEPIIKQKLNGSLEVFGNLQVSQNKLAELNANLKGFGGNISANLKDNNIDAKIDNIKLDELLKLAAQPAFASATINGEASIKKINDAKNMSGNLKINTKNGHINSTEFKKLSGLNMSNNVAFEISANTDIKETNAKFNAQILSDLLNLKNLNGEFDIQANRLSSNFNLIANDLAKFESIVGTKLSGSVDISGNLIAANNALNELDISGKALGGDIKAVLKNEKLNAKLSNLALKDIFVLVGQKPLADAIINMDANLASIADKNNLNGDINLYINKGEFYEKNMSEILEKSFPAKTKFNANSAIKISKGIANFEAKADSDLINLKDANGKFIIQSGSFNAQAKLNIPDLRKLKFLTQKELFGNIDMNIKADKNEKDLVVKADSKIFDGNLDATLKNNLLNANLSNFSFKGLTDMLGMQNFYNGKGNAKANYDLIAQNGKFKIDITQGRLAPNGFTNTIKTFTTRDITTEVYKDGYVDGNINKGVIKFDMMMKAERSDINSTAAMLDTTTDLIAIPLQFRYEKTDANINITGTTKEPKYSIKSDYLEKKIIKGIDKLLDKKLGGGKNDATKDAVKGLLKGLF